MSTCTLRSQRGCSAMALTSPRPSRQRCAKDDEVHLAFANTERRVIVTHDNDYLRFQAQGLPHPGMAYCPPQTRSIGQLVEMLRLMWEIMTPEEMRNRVEFL